MRPAWKRRPAPCQTRASACLGFSDRMDSQTVMAFCRRASSPLKPAKKSVRTTRSNRWAWTGTTSSKTVRTNANSNVKNVMGSSFHPHGTCRPPDARQLSDERQHFVDEKRLRPCRAEDEEIRGEASASERAGGGAPAPV